METVFCFAVIFMTMTVVTCNPGPATTLLYSAPTSLQLPLLSRNRSLNSGGATNPCRRAVEALQRPLLSSNEAGTFRIKSEIQDGIRYLLQTRNNYTLALHGTGTTGLHAVLDNLIEPGDKILVGVNGHWSELAANISSQRFGAELIKIEKPPGSRFSLSEIEAALQTHRPNFLCLINGESSTGVYQPLEGVGELCQKYDCITIADVIATVGMLPVKMDENKIDAVYMNSQKCCGGIVGLAPISFSDRAMRKIKNRKTLPKNYQTDMTGQIKAWAIEKSNLRYASVHSISLPLLYMLREGLANVVDEGLGNMWARHADAHQHLMWHAARLGLEPFVPNPEDRLVGTSLFNIPAGKDVFKIVAYMLNEYDIEISAGYQVTMGKVIRIGLFGSNANKESASRIMNALEVALNTPLTDL